MLAVDRSMHGSLREEVQMLRRRVVKLETAEADNGRLRKEMSRVQKAAEDQKAQMELDFMNQLSRAARENSLKLEEMEGRLTESNNVNRALGEQLASSETQLQRRVSSSGPPTNVAVSPSLFQTF